MVFLDIHVTQSRPIYRLNVSVSWILFNTRRLLLFQFLAQRILSLIEWAFIWAACVSIIRPHLEICNAEGLIDPVAGALISYLKYLWVLISWSMLQSHVIKLKYYDASTPVHSTTRALRDSFSTKSKKIGVFVHD